MLPVFADPKTDFVFKRIFGVEERKVLLVARALLPREVLIGAPPLRPFLW